MLKTPIGPILVVGKLVLLLSVDNFFLGQALIALIFIQILKV